LAILPLTSGNAVCVVKTKAAAMHLLSIDTVNLPSTLKFYFQKLSCAKTESMQPLTIQIFEYFTGFTLPLQALAVCLVRHMIMHGYYFLV